MLQRWENYCDNCVYLGAHKEYDLYVCPHGKKKKGTVVARFGEYGDYHSRELKGVDQFTAEGNFEKYAVALMVALARYRLAQKKGPWKDAVASFALDIKQEG